MQSENFNTYQNLRKWFSLICKQANNLLGSAVLFLPQSYRYHVRLLVNVLWNLPFFSFVICPGIIGWIPTNLLKKFPLTWDWQENLFGSYYFPYGEISDCNMPRIYCIVCNHYSLKLHAIICICMASLKQLQEVWSILLSLPLQTLVLHNNCHDCMNRLVTFLPL